jgi:hypothetical protein
MRQPGLGKLEWVKAAQDKAEAQIKQATAAENKKETKKVKKK